MTAQQVYERTVKVIPNISLGTVYRDLGQLADNGLITTIKFGNILRYDGNIHDHQHFICVQCHNIYDLELPLKKFVSGLETSIEHEVTQYDLVLKGICQKCQNKDK